MPCRQAALQEIARLLLTFLCTPAAPAPNNPSASTPVTPRLAPPSQVTIDIPANDPAHVTIRMPSPQGTATPTPAATPRTAAEKHWERQASVSRRLHMGGLVQHMASHSTDPKSAVFSVWVLQADVGIRIDCNFKKTSGHQKSPCSCYLFQQVPHTCTQASVQACTF